MMKNSKIAFLVSCILSFCSFNAVNAQFPSDSAKVYLLTASPGPETYSAFGHSAIRILDATHHVDLVYNYGTFDFGTPHFYEKFVFGRLLYSLSLERYDDFMYNYMQTGQAIFQQNLVLSNHEKWNIIQNLQQNYRVENRFYRYDFLYDDCSTRIRDMIEKSLDNKIIYPKAYVKDHVSFRHLLVSYIQGDAWMTLGFQIMLGPSADKIASTREYMFLPVHLMGVMGEAQVTDHGKVHPVTLPVVQSFPSTIVPEKTAFFSSPLFVFGSFFVLVLVLSFLGYKRKKYSVWFDSFLFGLTGILGLLLLVLWIGSLHQVLGRNLNILWASPLNIALVVGLLINRRSKWLRYLVMFTSLVLILTIPVSFLLTQHFPLESYLMVVILLIRCTRIYGANNF